MIRQFFGPDAVSLEQRNCGFDQLSDDRDDGDLAEPGNGAQDVARPRGGVIGVDEPCDFTVQLGNLFVDQGQAGPGLTPETGVCLNVAAILQPGNTNLH